MNMLKQFIAFLFFGSAWVSHADTGELGGGKIVAFYRCDGVTFTTHSTNQVTRRELIVEGKLLLASTRGDEVSLITNYIKQKTTPDVDPLNFEQTRDRMLQERGYVTRDEQPSCKQSNQSSD